MLNIRRKKGGKEKTPEEVSFPAGAVIFSFFPIMPSSGRILLCGE